jgi:O-antigen/teichoic acid export membrane protein
MLKTSVSNLFVRALTLASKFVLMVFLAKYETPEDLGIYGLMTVTISISLYLLGMDFYVYNTREILARNERKCLPLIRDQFVFHCATYLGILPLLLGVFVAGMLSWKFAAWFYVLLILEHLSQEAGRILITLSQSVMANVVMFLRTGAWVYAVIAIGFLDGKSLSLSTIWLGWIAGVSLSLCLAAYTLRNLPWRTVLTIPVDWNWIRRGTKVALPFLAASMSLLGVQYADRYFLQANYGPSVVGVYLFYASLANVMQVFIFTGVTMILYPRLVAAYQKGDLRVYRARMVRFAWTVAIAVTVMSAAALALIRPALGIIGKDVYSAQISIFAIMILSTAVICLAEIPHYALYVRRKDRLIVGSTVTALVVALVGNAVLVPRYGLTGAASATLIAMTSIAVLKTAAVFRIKSETIDEQIASGRESALVEEAIG